MDEFKDFILWLNDLDKYLGDDRLHDYLKKQIDAIDPEAIINNVRFKLIGMDESKRADYLAFCKGMSRYSEGNDYYIFPPSGDIAKRINDIMLFVWDGLARLEDEYSLADKTGIADPIPIAIQVLFRHDDNLAKDFLRECINDPDPKNVADRYKKLEREGKVVKHLERGCLKDLFYWLKPYKGVDKKYSNFTRKF